MANGFNGTPIYRFKAGDIDAYGFTLVDRSTSDFWFLFTAKAAGPDICIISSGDGTDRVLLGEASVELLTITDGTSTVQKNLALARTTFRIYEAIRIGGVVRLYENGAQIGTASTLSAAWGVARLGYNGAGSNFFDGDLSEVLLTG